MHLELMRVKDKELVLPNDISSITTARIWHCKYRSLEAIGNLVNLQVLVIATFPDQNLECISGLKSLRYLSILHMPKVSSIEPLVNLQDLESLSLSTLPSWDSSGKVTTIEALEPLSTLSKLRHIELFGVRPASKSLIGLEGCGSLESGRFSKYPKKEVERFSVKMGIENKFIPEPEYSGL